MMFNQYPYINVNDLNLDYILNQIRVMMNEVTNFVSINAIKYANPIQWDITRQYEKNTVVIDPITGTAYISVAPVPAGVALTRTEYWTVVFDLGSFVTKAAKNFTDRYEESTTLTATFPSNTGDWLVWGDILYKALTNITAGDTYVENGNIEHFTIEDIYISYLNTIANILTIVGDLADLNTTDKNSIVDAINEVVGNIGDLATLKTVVKTSIVSAINELEDKKLEIVKVSSLGGSFTFAELQTFIDNHNIIDFDVDYDVQGNTIMLHSNLEIFSSNESVITGDDCIFKADAHVTNTGYTGTLATQILNTTAPLTVGKRYILRGTLDGFDTGYPYKLGGATGTGGLNDCFYSCWSTVLSEDGGGDYSVSNGFIAYGGSTVSIWERDNLENIYLHNLNLQSRLFDQYYVHVVHFIGVSNSKIANCSIECVKGRDIHIQTCENIEVINCNLTVSDDNYDQIYQSNVLSFVGTHDSIARFNKCHGSQPIDLTYDSTFNMACENITLDSNVVYGTYGITIHPGNYSHKIINNFVRCLNGGIGLRGGRHEVANNHVYCYDPANSAGMGGISAAYGCLCFDIHDNVIQGFPIGIWVMEDATAEWSLSGVPYLKIHNNEFLNVCELLRITQVGSSNIALEISMNGNVMRRNGSRLPIRLINIEGTGTRQISDVAIKELLELGVTHNAETFNVAAGSARRCFIETTAIGGVIDKSYGGTVTETYLNAYAIGATNITTGTALSSLSPL